MELGRQANVPAKKRGIERRFRTINILFFLLIAVSIAFVAALVVGNITGDASRDYAGFYSSEAVSKFNYYLNRELGLVTKVARSGPLTRWFADETNEAKLAGAYEEMISYTDMLYSASLYFGIHASLNEYSVDKGAPIEAFVPFDLLNEAEPYDHWYFDCVHAPEEYTLNIDIDKVTNERCLWINHKVVDANGDILGVFCSGLPFGQVVEDLFGRYDNSSVRGFVIDRTGAIQMDSAHLDAEDADGEAVHPLTDISRDVAFVTAARAHLAGIEGYFSAGIEPSVVALSAGPYGYAAIAPIAGTDWSVVTLFNAESLFSARRLLPLLITLLAALVIYVLVITLVSQRLIFVPFDRLIDSLDRAGGGDDMPIYGYDMDNEFGDIAKTIQDMRGRLAAGNEALVRAVAAAEKASQAKSEFLSRMSHEIRTPMNAIIGMTKIADHTDDVAKLRYCLATIGASSDQLLSLINDILDMSKIEAGKFELEAVPMNLEKTLMKVCNLMGDKAEQKRQSLEVALDGKLRMHYVADELRLSQVVTNLLSNAVKFTPEDGRITLSVDAVETGETSCLLRFTVTDTGIGMTEAQIGRLFTSFEQADGSISRRFGGTGLGLAISKNIVEKMGGRIWAEAEKDKGSTFFFEVRLDTAPESRRVIFDGITPSDLRVLIVDASDDIRRHFRAVVSGFGIHADDAATGADAERLVRESAGQARAYDVVFVDYALPDMDGIAAVAALNNLIDKNTVIIMTSFLAWNKIEKDANSVGVSRFIPKPLFPSSILDAINDVVGSTLKQLDIATAAARTVPDFSGVTLLLAEDVAINREIFLALLEETHVTIDTAENGLEAVAKFEAAPDQYNLIVMDIQMPEMDGYEATRRIRALPDPRAKAVPIIAMTANAFQEDVNRCLACGMNGHLAKPIDEKAVMETIARYAGR